MEHWYARTEMLFGEAAVERLRTSRVAVFGIGGVGGYVCEALVRSGVGAFDLVDKDKVDITNLNRQIIATTKTIGKLKTQVMQERMLEINPEAEVRVHDCFFLPETSGQFSFEEYDYVVDAVDTVTAKIELILRAQACGVPVISSMGAGNKADPTRFEVADIYETSVCPLARVMRRELKARGVKSLKVVYSKEPPIRWTTESFDKRDMTQTAEDTKGKTAVRREKAAPGSVAFVPSAAGLIIAGEVVKDLICGGNEKREEGK